MGRQREFEQTEVERAAGEVFWERGFQPTSIGDLEQATGIDRSSMYRVYGSKRGLFDSALDDYMANRVGPLVALINGQNAGENQPAVPGVNGIEMFFQELAAAFRSGDHRASFGCFVVNTAAELGPDDPQANDVSTRYQDQLRTAFRSAMVSAGADDADADHWARQLTATTMGIWVTARINPADAADACLSTIELVRLGTRSFG